MVMMYLRTGRLFIYLNFFTALLALCSCSKNTDLSELVKRKGVVYKIETGEPFTGIAVSYYGKEKKNKKKHTEYKNGLIDGIETVWHKSGELMARKNYVKGRLHGESIRWYKNGQRKSVETYKKGKQSGRQSYWRKDGSLIKDRIIN